ncbi:MAG: phosphate ABC transporter permease PstA [Sedimentisphaerales bacterium]|nr:phosphate ABC transporter permease PstA [Sedimentisphaerales bacterium]
MKVSFRNTFDKTFTVLTALSVVFISLVLLGILGPMIWRGSGAVVFKGTVEFRKMQMALFERGNQEDLQDDITQSDKFRNVVYETIDKFKKGIDAEALCERARDIHRQFGQELRLKGITGQQYSQLRSVTRDIRDKLETAFESADKKEITENIEFVLQFKDDEQFKSTCAEEFFQLALGFQKAVAKIDLAKRKEYEQDLAEIEQTLFGSGELPGLLGPQPDKPLPALAMNRFGATRWDQALRLLDRLLWIEEWVETEPGKPLEKVLFSRKEKYAGTDLAPLFGYVEDNLVKLLRPKLTFYWRFFIDDNFNSHYFGGVGPEILGTLVITFLGMLFAVPLGLVSAAYLVECAPDNFILRIIRMCINTLAGVPSIVFGLFGLSFFVLFLFPLFGMPSKGCILAASLTLAILTLPVMIRASEEAIRTVPQTYKEASLALGASGFRTFVTVTLPAALPGILTGVILSLSRIAGETAPILFTGAVAMGPMPKSLFDPARTLSYGSYDMAVGDRISMMVPHNQYGMVVTLIMLVLCLNALAIGLRWRVFKRLKGH